MLAILLFRTLLLVLLAVSSWLITFEDKTVKWIGFIVFGMVIMIPSLYIHIILIERLP